MAGADTETFLQRGDGGGGNPTFFKHELNFSKRGEGWRVHARKFIVKISRGIPHVKLTSLHDWISHFWDDLCLGFVSTSLEVLIQAMSPWDFECQNNSLHLLHKLKILYRNTELGILFLHFVQQKQFIMRHGWVIYINIPHLSTFYICNVEDIIRTRNLLTNCPPYISAKQHPDRTKKNAWKIFKGKISSNKFSNKAKKKKLQLLHLVKRYFEFWTCSECH